MTVLFMSFCCSYFVVQKWKLLVKHLFTSGLCNLWVFVDVTKTKITFHQIN